MRIFLLCAHCKKIGDDSSKCKKMLMVKSLGKDGVDHIAAGKEHKQQDVPTFSGGNKRVTWAPKDKDISAPATVPPQSSPSTGIQTVLESTEGLIDAVSDSVKNQTMPDYNAAAGSLIVGPLLGPTGLQ